MPASVNILRKVAFIDIANGLYYSFHTLPALVASSPQHNLIIFLLPLNSDDPTIILAADAPLECHLSEKDLFREMGHSQRL